MPVLNLGTLDLPYADEEGKSTGDVAEILEQRYHIMEFFWEIHGEECANDLAQGFAGALENQLLGGPAPDDLYAEGYAKIEERFRDFLTNRELDGVGGTQGYQIPTAAALRGVSHRFAHPYARRPSRPSFIDTSLFETSFRAWIEGKLGANV